MDTDVNENEVHLPTSNASQTYVIIWLKPDKLIDRVTMDYYFTEIRKVSFNYPNASIKTIDNHPTDPVQFTKLFYGAQQATIRKPLTWTSMAFSPDHSMGLIWDEFSTVKVIDVSTWTEIHTITP